MTSARAEARQFSEQVVGLQNESRAYQQQVDELVQAQVWWISGGFYKTFHILIYLYFFFYGQCLQEHRIRAEMTVGSPFNARQRLYNTIQGLNVWLISFYFLLQCVFINPTSPLCLIQYFPFAEMTTEIGSLENILEVKSSELGQLSSQTKCVICIYHLQ